jgi:signal transduction histidine kinase
MSLCGLKPYGAEGMFLRKFKMKIKSIIVCMCLILLGFVFVMLNMVRQISVAKLDIVAVNDVVETIKKDWPGDFINISSKAAKYGLELAVIDKDNVLKFATRSGLRETINEAIKHRDTILDIDVDGQIVGKVIIYNNENERLKEAKKNVINASVALFTLFLALCTGYLLYLNQKIIKPFNSLKSFAVNVAAGKLHIPLEMDRDNIFGAFTESFDIMREELGRARESERKANASKKELVASLSHDIKTPVASIKAVAELMLIKAKDEKQKSQLETIGSKADQIELLINNLFTSTLEELSELKVQVKDEESTILYEIIQCADYSHRIKPFSISECIIRCDKLRLQQVLDNVISNSYKYADTEIEVRTEIIDNFLVLHICDLGKGVKDEELPLILQKFYRGQNANGQSGSGLGFYISKYFMEKMEGRLSVRNLPKGFEVTLYLYLS